MLAGRYADTEPRNVFVTIHENQFSNWSFGNGIGQYLERNQSGYGTVCTPVFHDHEGFYPGEG